MSNAAVASLVAISENLGTSASQSHKSRAKIMYRGFPLEGRTPTMDVSQAQRVS